METNTNAHTAGPKGVYANPHAEIRAWQDAWSQQSDRIDALVAERDAYRDSTEKLTAACNDAIQVGNKLLTQRDALKDFAEKVAHASFYDQDVAALARAALALCEKKEAANEKR